MTPEEQKKFCLNKTIKNVIVGSLICMPTFGIGTAVYSTYRTMTGDNPSLGPKQYLKQLDTLINAYNVDIAAYNKKLKELKAKN